MCSWRCGKDTSCCISAAEVLCHPLLSRWMYSWCMKLCNTSNEISNFSCLFECLTAAWCLFVIRIQATDFDLESFRLIGRRSISCATLTSLMFRDLSTRMTDRFAVDVALFCNSYLWCEGDPLLYLMCVCGPLLKWATRLWLLVRLQEEDRMYTRLEIPQYLSFVFFYVVTPDTQDNISSTADGQVQSRTGLAQCWRVWTLVCEQWTWHLSVFDCFWLLCSASGSETCMECVFVFCGSDISLHVRLISLNFGCSWLPLSWRPRWCRWPICA